MYLVHHKVNDAALEVQVKSVVGKPLELREDLLQGGHVFLLRYANLHSENRSIGFTGASFHDGIGTLSDYFARFKVILESAEALLRRSY